MLNDLLLLSILSSYEYIVVATSFSSNNSYKNIDGYLCINSQYTEQHNEISTAINCAALCSRNQRCQAFTTADGPCQLFVFDKCSKSVRDCSCSRRGQVFVKQQPGLEPGALCASGYGDDLCGVKYKMYYNIWDWLPGRQKCESESGLVIMADVIDTTEMNQVQMLFRKSNWHYQWLGGYQTPGSVEPAGGWYWVACNISIDASLWDYDEPNNYIEGVQVSEEAVSISHRPAGLLSDIPDTYAKSQYGYYVPDTVLCECVSPFN